MAEAKLDRAARGLVRARPTVTQSEAFDARANWPAAIRCSVTVVVAGLLLVGATAAPVGAVANGWSIVPSPTISPVSVLYGVSCTSATACTAVGEANNGSATGTVTLVEHWDGTAWSIVASPNPAGSTDSSLRGVSCTSATDCTAVGLAYPQRSAFIILVEHWDGTAWSMVASPNPAGSPYSVLYGVSCTSATDCTAVGTTSNGSAFVTLVEHWDGTSWSIVASPNPAGSTGSYLNGVSCTSSTACTAVGVMYTGSGSVMLVQHWDGTAWSIVASPNPANSTDSNLHGVACTTATLCTAVGETHNNVSGNFTLVEHWDGTAWSIVDTPSPAGPTGSVLYGISCTGATACTAVGARLTETGYYITLVEHWDGTAWSIVDTPNPVGSTSSYLFALSCTGATACTAVGETTNGFTYATQVESEVPMAVPPASTASAPASPSILLGRADSDALTVTGSVTGGSPSGTVSFHVCGPLPSASGCPTGGSAVGSSVTVTPGRANTSSATSPLFTPTATGTYCFRADYSGDSNYLASSDASPTECFGVFNRIITGPSGSITIGSGQAVFVQGATVSGSISSDGASSLTMCATTLTGSLNVSNTTGFVFVGDHGDDGMPGCAGNTLNGAVSLSNNGNQIEVGGNKIGGLLIVTNSTGAGPNTENANSEIEANHIGGSLICSGNTATPTNDGQPNTVNGSRNGQCGAAGF
jgi:hypothetical protein